MGYPAEASANPAKELFLDALEILGPEDRGAFLERHCGLDTPLRAEVEDLLRHHGQVDVQYQERPAADDLPALLPSGGGGATSAGAMACRFADYELPA